MRRERNRLAQESTPTGRHLLSLLLLLVLLGLPAVARSEVQEKDSAAKVEVRLSDYAIEMPRTLAAGPTLFLVHNDGRKNHSFKIEGPGVDGMLETVVRPHAAGSLAVTLKPGEYKVYCPLGSHAAKGMTMTLAVSPAQPRLGSLLPDK